MDHRSLDQAITDHLSLSLDKLEVTLESLHILPRSVLCINQTVNIKMYKEYKAKSEIEGVHQDLYKQLYEKTYEMMTMIHDKLMNNGQEDGFYKLEDSLKDELDYRCLIQKLGLSFLKLDYA